MYFSIYSLQSSTQRLPIRALFGFTLKLVGSYPPLPLRVSVCGGLSLVFTLGCLKFRNFRRHMLHTTLEAIFETLYPAMSEPKAKLCADGHYHCTIYGLGPYIADYPEQVLLACISVAVAWLAVSRLPCARLS